MAYLYETSCNIVFILLIFLLYSFFFHIFLFQTHTCSKCNFKASFKSQLERHELVHSDKGKFVCNICEITYKRKDKLQRHNAKKHSIYDCRKCDLSFTDLTERKEHEQNCENKVKVFECYLCNYSTSNKSLLHMHMCAHTGNKHYLCSICFRSFARKSSCQTHEKTHEKSGAKRVAVNNIWKTESKQSGGYYVNLFEFINKRHKENVDKWIQQKMSKLQKSGKKQEKFKKNTNINAINTFEMKLSFNEYERLPGVADVLDIKVDEQYGRHVIAKCDIDIGKTILIKQNFASAIISSSKRCYCLTCEKIIANGIKCKGCAYVRFCNEECEKSNQIHYLECNTIYHYIERLEIKLAIQMVLMTINEFSDANTLRKRVENIIAKKDLVLEDSLEIILKLQRSKRKTAILYAYEAYTYLMTMKSVSSYFKTVQNQRFLMHLAFHYVAIIAPNAWGCYLDSKNDIGNNLNVKI